MTRADWSMDAIKALISIWGQTKIQEQQEIVQLHVIGKTSIGMYEPDKQKQLSRGHTHDIGKPMKFAE